MTALEWALWGLAGAFVYAAPRTVVAASETLAAGRKFLPVLAEGAVALFVGPICSVGLGPVAGSYIHAASGDGLRAVGLVVGMVANPVSPLIVKLVSAGVLRRFGSDKDGER
jgi:hypothetical protein